MNDDNEPEIMSEDEAMAILEKCKDQMLKQYDINDLADPDANALAGAHSMLAGPKTELGFRRILRDIKESGNDD